MCELCRAMTDQDGLTIRTLEITGMTQNACAPITYYQCRCKTCGTRWSALEVYDERGEEPSRWSWEREPSPA